MPAAHCAQAALRSLAASDPGLHSVDVVDPVGHALPTGHGEHSDAPADAPKVPDAHTKQFPLPATAYSPAAHCSAAVAPAGHALPAGHGEHSAAPADEKEPAAQSVHTLLPAAAYSPAAHCSAAVAAVGHAEPAGQLLQPVCDVRSVAALK